jgi:hypothetical protein
MGDGSGSSCKAESWVGNGFQAVHRIGKTCEAKAWHRKGCQAAYRTEGRYTRCEASIDCNGAAVGTSLLFELASDFVTDCVAGRQEEGKDTRPLQNQPVKLVFNNSARRLMILLACFTT